MQKSRDKSPLKIVGTAPLGAPKLGQPDFFYRLKKWFALYPGVVRPVSAEFLSDHYRERREHRSVRRAALDAGLGVGFRLWAPFRARSVARKFGLDQDWARRASRIARRRFVDPNDLALFRISDPHELDLYMRRFEHAAINKRINPAGWRDDCALADKALFYERCAAQGLPHPELLATIDDGRVEVVRQASPGPLAMKMVNGEGGSGFQVIHLPEGEDFAAFLRERFGSLRGRWLVQPKVSNHEAMRGLSMNALSTVRVTTMLNEEGAPEVVTSVLRFPSLSESAVDNIKAGGLMAPVDLETGRLGEACRGRGPGEYRTHPVTGAPIDGVTLPFWPEVRALVERAHRDFPEYNLVGWDVAITGEGPILIEGNGKPCMIVAQRANRRGVGATRFGALVAHHLRLARENEAQRS